MLSKSWLFTSDPVPPSKASDIIRNHRARLAAEEEARAEERRQAQAEQSSISRPPSARIRAWEKMHGLRLPLNADHPVLKVVSIATDLTLAEVRQEQRTRGARHHRHSDTESTGSVARSADTVHVSIASNSAHAADNAALDRHLAGVP